MPRLDYERDDDRRRVLRDLRDGILTETEAIAMLIEAGDSRVAASCEVQRILEMAGLHGAPIRVSQASEPSPMEPADMHPWNVSFGQGHGWSQHGQPIYLWRTGSWHTSPPTPEEEYQRGSWPMVDVRYEPVYRRPGQTWHARRGTTPRAVIRDHDFFMRTFDSSSPTGDVRFLNSMRQVLRWIDQADPVTDEWRLPPPAERQTPALTEIGEKRSAEHIFAAFYWGNLTLEAALAALQALYPNVDRAQFEKDLNELRARRKQ